MAEHTKGPWRLWISSDARPHSVVGPAGFRPDGASVARIVDVSHYGSTNALYAPEQEANARLIASAPELLEALVVAEADIAAWEDEFSKLSKPSNVLAVVRAAILKAAQP